MRSRTIIALLLVAAALLMGGWRWGGPGHAPIQISRPNGWGWHNAAHKSADAAGFTWTNVQDAT